MGFFKTLLRIITLGFAGKEKVPKGAQPEGNVEEDISKKLDKLSSAIDRRPGQTAELRKVFLKYQTVIQKNRGKIKDKSRINAQLQAIKKSMGREKQKPKKKAA